MAPVSGRSAAACRIRGQRQGCIRCTYGFPMPTLWRRRLPAPLLSGILTKTGVFGILAVTVTMFRHDMAWGMVLLVPGAVTMVLGAILAVFSIDLKRTLACSSMSQIGFILTGCAMQCLLGEENGLAVSGTVLHMVNHSMIKLVLFMAAGCIYMNLHKLDLNEIRGYGRNKPFLMLVLPWVHMAYAVSRCGTGM